MGDVQEFEPALMSAAPSRNPSNNHEETEMFKAAEELQKIEAEFMTAIIKSIQEMDRVAAQCAGVDHCVMSAIGVVVCRQHELKREVIEKWQSLRTSSADYDRKHSWRHEDAVCPSCSERGGVVRMRDARSTVAVLASGIEDPELEPEVSLFDEHEYFCCECNSEIEYDDIVRVNKPGC